jgi:capsular polysaccharide biosynthesis protein
VSQPSEVEFRSALLSQALRRHVVLILLTGFLFAALGVLAGYLWPAKQTSTAVVLVNPLTGNPFTPDGRGADLTNLETEAQLVPTDAVAQLVQQQLGRPVPPAELVRDVDVTTAPNTQVLHIGYTARSATVARDRAQAFATAYLAYRLERARSLVNGEIARLREQQAAVNRNLTQASREMTSNRDGTPERALAVEQVRTLTTENIRLTSEIATRDAIQLDPGQVITPAGLPTPAPLRAAALFGAAGLMLGLAAGVLLAVVRERADDRLRDPEDVEQLGMLLLGEVGATTGPGQQEDATETTEEYRRLRTSVLTVLHSLPAVLAVTTPDDSPKGPVTAAPLAAALARSGIKVVVVDGAGRLGDLVPEGARGIPEVVSARTPARSLLHRRSPELAVLPHGQWTDETAEHLDGGQLRDAVRSLRNEVDVVMIVAPGLHTADGQTLVRVADCAVLESTAERTTRTDLARAAERLARAGGTVLGTVLVRDGRRGRRRRVLRPRARATAQHAVGVPGIAPWYADERRPYPAAPVEPTATGRPEPAAPAEAEPAVEDAGTSP